MVLGARANDSKKSSVLRYRLPIVVLVRCGCRWYPIKSQCRNKKKARADPSSDTFYNRIHVAIQNCAAGIDFLFWRGPPPCFDVGRTLATHFQFLRLALGNLRGQEEFCPRRFLAPSFFAFTTFFRNYT